MLIRSVVDAKEVKIVSLLKEDRRHDAAIRAARNSQQKVWTSWKSTGTVIVSLLSIDIIILLVFTVNVMAYSVKETQHTEVKLSKKKKT